MPQVPYNPVPQTTQATATPSVDVPTPIAAFGGTIADAIGSVGKVASHAGDEIFQRAVALQNLENETMAKEADANYVMEVGQLRARYSALQGQDAVRAYPKFIQDMQSLRSTYRAGLPNDMARRMFDRDSLQFMSRNVFNGAGHAATENRQWTAGASTARVEAGRNNVLQDPTPQNLSDNERQIEEESYTQAALHGWGDDPVPRENWIRKQRSATLVNYIQGLAPKDPFAAKDFFEKNRGQIDGALHDNVESVINRNLYTKGSIRISEEVNPIPQEGVDGPTLRERLDTAKRRAEEMVPGDPNFARAVQEKVTQDYKHGREVLRNDQQNRDAVIVGAINGNNGKVPTTLAELLAGNGNSQQAALIAGAWDNTPEPKRRTFLNMLAANSRGETRPTAEGLARFNYLKGLAVENSAEFLNVNIVEGETNRGMTRNELNHLMNLQLRLRQAPEANPQVQLGLRMTRPIWGPQGVGLDPVNNRDRYLQFVGAFQDAIQNFQKENNRPPRGTEEWNKLASEVLQVTKPLPWYNFWSSQPERRFEQSIPQDKIERFRADYKSNFGREPDQNEIRLFERDWRAREYQRLFGKKKQ